MSDALAETPQELASMVATIGPRRCFDCFGDFDAGGVFAVLKQMRDVVIPPDAIEPPSFHVSMAHDAVFVCADCAAWYGDDALKVDSPYV